MCTGGALYHPIYYMVCASEYASCRRRVIGVPSAMPIAPHNCFFMADALMAALCVWLCYCIFVEHGLMEVFAALGDSDDVLLCCSSLPLNHH